MYLGLIFAILFGAEGFLNSIVINANTNSPVTFQEFSIYSYPDTWHMLTFLGGMDIIKLFLALIIIIFVSKEFTHKTIRQNIMNGLSRQHFLFSKVLFILILSLLATVLVTLSGIFLGLKHTEVFSMSLMLEKIAFLPAYFLEMFTYSTFVLLLVFLVKRPVMSVAVLIFYYFGEWIFSANLPESVGAYLPFVSIGNIIDRPNTPILQSFGVSFREVISTPDVFTCLIYCFVFIGIVYLMLRRSDI
jgi:ABC-type transport system involved in multi-copper enzyme maturation permease subunit